MGSKPLYGKNDFYPWLKKLTPPRSRRGGVRTLALLSFCTCATLASSLAEQGKWFGRSSDMLAWRVSKYVTLWYKTKKRYKDLSLEAEGGVILSLGFRSEIHISYRFGDKWYFTPFSMKLNFRYQITRIVYKNWGNASPRLARCKCSPNNNPNNPKWLPQPLILDLCIFIVGKNKG